MIRNTTCPGLEQAVSDGDFVGRVGEDAESNAGTADGMGMRLSPCQQWGSGQRQVGIELVEGRLRGIMVAATAGFGHEAHAHRLGRLLRQVTHRAAGRRLAHLRMTTAMQAALLSRLAAAIVMGAREICGGDGLDLWCQPVQPHVDQVGGHQQIPSRSQQQPQTPHVQPILPTMSCEIHPILPDGWRG